jgi:glycosyltransferase involved in cell wall biosynthesis
MKGLHLTIGALAKLKDQQWRHIIIGEGKERQSLEALANKLEIKDRVTFAGRVGDEDLVNYYAAADAFLNPEMSQPAFGLVALEALLQGTPVLANRVGAVPEVVGENGGELIDDFSVDAWREKLFHWLKEERWKNYDAAQLRADAKSRFSFYTMIDETLKVYEKALSKRK